MDVELKLELDEEDEGRRDTVAAENNNVSSSNSAVVATCRRRRSNDGCWSELRHRDEDDEASGCCWSFGRDNATRSSS